MKISINNFIIPYFIIKSICRDVGCYPMDVSVEFSSVPKSETSPVAFSVLESFSRKQVNLIVLSKYLENFENIHGMSIDLSTIQGALSTCAFMCDIYFDQSIYEIPKTECENSNFPFVFIATKNIIYPYFNLDLRKENIVCDPSALYDFVISDSSINFGIKNLKAEYRDAFVLMGIDCCTEKLIIKILVLFINL